MSSISTWDKCPICSEVALRTTNPNPIYTEWDCTNPECKNNPDKKFHCEICHNEVPEDEEIFCIHCGKHLCSRHAYSINQDKHPEIKGNLTNDMCQECFIKMGFYDIWEVHWYERGGDTYTSKVKVPMDMNTFQAKAWLSKGGGIWHVGRLKKTRKYGQEDR